jgi:aerobic-type carbon monoxide dehydrogenase small subunit (CoxS/CutS family)
VTLLLELEVNGDAVQAVVEPQELLLDFLRDRLGLKGAKRSCEVQVCGTCTVLVDGLPVSSCCMLACEAGGRSVLTIEGFARDEEFPEFQEAFTRHAALQCGFCTGGFVLTLKALRDSGELGDEDEIRHALDSNVCRCTGYQSILAAARDLAAGS